jgi:hypothetical protein
MKVYTDMGVVIDTWEETDHECDESLEKDHHQGFPRVIDQLPILH